MSTSVASSDDTPSLAVIDGFVLDCLLSDTHTFESEVTEFPVESGSTISDNIRSKPLVISLEAIVSNTPLTFAGNFRASGSVPSIDAYAKLLAIRRDRRLVTIATSLETYDNMALESITIPRASGRGDELRFSATFKQVEIVINKREKRVAIPTAQSHSSASTFTRSQIVADRYVYINMANRTWYDDVISSWRETVEYLPLKGQWLLNADRPLLIEESTWNNERIDQHVSSVLRPRMIKLQGGVVRPFLYKTPFAGIIMLRPGGYIIEAFVTVKGLR